MPRTSVLMPARNAARFVSLAVRSTLRAMPRDAELVLLDDASVDNTASIAVVAARGDERFRIIRLDAGIGVAGGLNLLLERSDSEFVARMDADDVCLPWRFHLQKPRMARRDFTFSSVRRIDSRGVPMVRSPMPVAMNPRTVSLALLLGNVLVHPTMFARRAALSELGNYRATASEDYDLWLRAADAGMRLEMSARTDLLYRTHAGQLSANNLWRSVAVDSLSVGSYDDLAHSRLGVRIASQIPDAWASTGLYATLTQEDFELFRAAFLREERSLGVFERTLIRLRRRRRFSTLPDFEDRTG